jgi:SAM-dependent methyltransferase
MTRNLGYLAQVVRGRLSRSNRSCPYCGSAAPNTVGTKHLVLVLCECRECGLKYRYPKDNPVAAAQYYEQGYAEETVVDVPPLPELSEMVARNFVGSKFDKSDKVSFIQRFVPPATPVLDFGASFGYMMHQLQGTGYSDLFGYELSQGRSAMAREVVGVHVTSDLGEVQARTFGCVYASHVLEHLPSLRPTLSLFHEVLVPDGMLILWMPNATNERIAGEFAGSWAPLVGEPHTMAFDYDFLARSLPREGFEVTHEGDRSADELCVVACRR